MSQKKITYKDTGVDTHEGTRAVQLMKESVRSTFGPNVIGDLGSFGGMFRLGSGYRSPVLVSGTDGVGTKLKLAFAMDRHDTVGVDLVAMCVNDILCLGAKPLFFLDYVATGKVRAEQIAQVVSGIADGCRQSGAALLGGETAEMAGFYAAGEYDLAGFAVGVVEESEIIDGSRIRAGDRLIALPSSGVHSNGYSLVRRLIPESRFGEYSEALGATIGEVLLRPTRIYENALRPLFEHASVFRGIHGLVHVTGGGFYENIPRPLPKGHCAVVRDGSWTVPPIFRLLEDLGVEHQEMLSTFNMGVGMILIVDAESVGALTEVLRANGETYYEIGCIERMEDPEAEACCLVR